MSKKNALHSLYGGKQAAARAQSIAAYLAGQGVELAPEQLHEIMLLAKGKSALAGNIGGQEREQVVLTPAWMVRQLHELAGGQIWLDPCTEPSNPVGATYHLTEGALERAWGIGDRNLRYYCNPPYAKLGDWLEHASTQLEHKLAYGWVLCPVRPNRTYWHAYAQVLTVSLRPFAFQGHTSAFPAPMCLLCYGAPVPTSLLDDRGREMILGISGGDPGISPNLPAEQGIMSQILSGEDS